jgi:hypothetical protein
MLGVEPEGGVEAERLDLVHPANDRPRVGVVEILDRAALLAEDAAGAVLDHLPALLDHHVALRDRRGRRRREVRHAVRLHRHHEFEAVGRDALEVAGVVVGGEGVVLAAVGAHDPAELAVGERLGPLEHHVLEEVGETRQPRRIVRGAHPVPHHVGDDRRAVILDHDALEPVREGEGRDPVVETVGGCRLLRRDRSQRHEDEGERAGDEAHGKLRWLARQAIRAARGIKRRPREGDRAAGDGRFSARACARARPGPFQPERQKGLPR